MDPQPSCLHSSAVLFWEQSKQFIGIGNRSRSGCRKLNVVREVARLELKYCEESARQHVKQIKLVVVLSSIKIEEIEG